MNFLLFANWKMQLECKQAAILAQETVNFLAKIDTPHGVRVGVFPSSLHCKTVHDIVSPSEVSWGVQDVSAAARGAYTGQVSALDAARMGACYSLVGHAEVRAHFCDGDEQVVEKALRCKEAGLIPVVCFGSVPNVQPEEQARRLLDSLMERSAWEDIVLAFEPLAAIGSGAAYDACDVAALAFEVKRHADCVSFVYGGSVNAENVGAFALSGIQGVLVGGSSQSVEAWRALLQVAVDAVKG